MAIFQSAVAARLVFILGITNLVTAVLVLMSCRCIPALRITGNLMNHKLYKQFFRLHCYIWWFFWISVVAHAILALGRLGSPF
jgi:hypothetical protein